MRLGMRIRGEAATFLIICLLPGIGYAGIAFEQPSRFPRQICDCWTSDRGDDGGSWQSYDDFMLGENALITEFQWQGAYWDTRDGNETLHPIEPETEEWLVAIHRNRELNGWDMPSSRVGSIRVDVDEVETTFLGAYPLGDLDSAEQGQFDYDVNVYDFKVVLDEPIALEADTLYWFSPLSFSPTLQPLFVWTASDIAGKSRQVNGATRYIRNNNFVFSLTSLDGDFNNDSSLDLTDIEMLLERIAIGEPHATYDLNLDGAVSELDLESWVHDFKVTWFGDANLDGEFNSSDLVAVFTAGKYETGNGANWTEGDWSADGYFDSGDLVVAFQDGGYEMGPRAAVAAIPEPAGQALTLISLVSGLMLIRCPFRNSRGRRNLKSLFVGAAVAMFVGLSGESSLRAQVLLDSNFDDLTVGTAPDRGVSAGQWQLYDQMNVRNIDNNGTIEYEEFYLYQEAFDEHISIVDTSSFDATRSGNSLRVMHGESNIQMFHPFTETVHEDLGKKIRLSFEVFSKDREGTAGAVVILAGDHGGGGWGNRWDRAAQLVWQEDALTSGECDSPTCRWYEINPRVEDYPDGVWQQVRADVDLTTDTYDLYWAADGAELSQVGDDLGFRSGPLEILDRLNIAYFNVEGPGVPSDVEFYVDNIRVELIDDVPAVPEPSASVLALGFVWVVGCYRRRRRC